MIARIFLFFKLCVLSFNIIAADTSSDQRSQIDLPENMPDILIRDLVSGPQYPKSYLLAELWGGFCDGVLLPLSIASHISERVRGRPANYLEYITSAIGDAITLPILIAVSVPCAVTGGPLGAAFQAYHGICSRIAWHDHNADCGRKVAGHLFRWIDWVKKARAMERTPPASAQDPSANNPENMSELRLMWLSGQLDLKALALAQANALDIIERDNSNLRKLLAYYCGTPGWPPITKSDIDEHFALAVYLFTLAHTLGS